MHTIFSLLMVLFFIFTGTFSPVNAEEVILKNGNKINYGHTWENDGMIWFYFHDSGVAGITKSAIIDKKGFLGCAQDNTFISKKYNCEISVPQGWHVTNAVEAIDLMPLENKFRQELKNMPPQQIMKKIGFLVKISKNKLDNRQTYNPTVTIKVEDKSKYPGVKTPLDTLKNNALFLKTIYKNFNYNKKPQGFVLNNIPSANQKFTYDMLVDNKLLSITQWQYAFVKNDKIYTVAALNTSDKFKNTEKSCLKTLKSFRFID